MSNPSFGLGAAPPNTNIFVAGLPAGTDDAKLREIFSAYGDVVWCKVMREGRDGRIPAIVEFSNLEHATWVVANVNGGIPQGLTEPVDVKFKDERHGHEKGGGKGHRFSPYGPPDSTAFDAFLAQPPAPPVLPSGFVIPPPPGQPGAGFVVPPPGPPPKPVDPTPSDNVYIKGLPINTDEALLKQVFSSFGSVTQCRVCPGGETRKTALVRFGNLDEAISCITVCNAGTVPAGLTEPVEVRFADTWDTKQRRSSDGTEFSIEVIVKGFESSGLMPGCAGRYDNDNKCALYIAGLPSDTTDYHLFKLFSPLGPIAPRGVRALLNEDGSCKGIAFVNYQREDSVHAAIAVYNGAILPDGSKLKVQQKAPKPQPQVCRPPPVPIVAQAARVIPPPGGEREHGDLWLPESPRPSLVPPPADLPTSAEAAPTTVLPPANVAAPAGVVVLPPPLEAAAAATAPASEATAPASGAPAEGPASAEPAAPAPGSPAPAAPEASSLPPADGGGGSAPPSPDYESSDSAP